MIRINSFISCILAASCFLSVSHAGNIHSAGHPAAIRLSDGEWPGVEMAARSLSEDFARVSGSKATFSPDGNIIIGSMDRSDIRSQLGASEISALEGRREMYLMKVEGGKVIIAGSDKRGTIYGIYSLSRKMGVSPWYWWADVPTEHHDTVLIADGRYTEGEPAVRYRGIFLNDEAPCLTSWVKNFFGTDYGGHEFYERVFELLLRLKGNFLWPAMWGWAFYADDPLNSALADTMGIIMGTSHHEPMARNHQEWARHRAEYGAWDYITNRKTVERFFREGMERAKGTEDLITIGMRGDGDTALGGSEGHDDEYTPDDRKIMSQLEKVIDAQRRIIRQVTGKPASQRPQVWALYKEVQKYYELGLKVPDDVTILLSDDNWGDVRKLPDAAERQRKGGWGMYYHVDYVGAPRNSKWLNVTPIQNLWEQMQLTWSYGVDRIWVLNVGDLKPMEYPIDLFLDMAWDPGRLDASTLLDHTLDFCREQFGSAEGADAARILNLYSKYSGRTTVEMMDKDTYDLPSSEFRKVCDELARLEAEALRGYLRISEDSRDAYRQLILFPVQALSNIYEMYYAQAMNHDLARRGDPAANAWADRVQECFERDAFLCHEYNKVMSRGKWDGMMTQKHIGYKSWNDDFPADTVPVTVRVEGGGHRFFFPCDKRGYTSIEAPHYYEAKASAGTHWTDIPYMGRTLGGVALMPYTLPAEGASLSYALELPDSCREVEVRIVVKSTLAFQGTPHRYSAAFEGHPEIVVPFNERLNENPENIYSVYYPTVARRVVESVFKLEAGGGKNKLVIKPMDPGIVFEKIVVNYGGYTKQYLFGEESYYFSENK